MQRQEPENEKLEYNENITNTFLKTVSAFANFDGGTIIFGVKDDRTISPLSDIYRIPDMISSKINDSIRPVPDYRIAVDESNKTVRLDILSGRQTPYRYKGKVYQRRNAVTIEADSYTENDLILLGRNTSYDALPSDHPELSFNTFQTYAKNTIGIERAGSDVLISMGLKKSNGYNHAAELLSDVNSFLGTEAAVFGDSINIIKGRSEWIHQSVLDQFENAAKLFRTHYVEEQINGIRRIEVQKIPEAAFREALANAIVHRNWQISANILIRMFPDRIEILSPGGLPAGVSQQDYLEDTISVPRNPILAYVFLRMGLIERLGTGILRIKESYRNVPAKPEFIISEQSIKVVLPLLDKKEPLSTEESQLLNQMQPDILYSRSELEKMTGLSKAAAARRLKALVSKGYLKIYGAGRNTRYLTSKE